MARLPAGAIRRALSAMLSDVRQGASGGADLGMGIGAYGGAAGGAALGGAVSASTPEEDGGMALPFGGMGAGAGIAAGGALGGLLGGGRGLGRGVRSALQELVREEPQRALSTIPRRRFTEAELQELVGEIGPRYGSGRHPMDGGRSNPMTEMRELQALRDKLRELRAERRFAADEEEAYDIDLQIAAIERELGAG